MILPLALVPLLVLGLGIASRIRFPKLTIEGAPIVQLDNDDNEGVTVFSHSRAARHCQCP